MILTASSAVCRRPAGPMGRSVPGHRTPHPRHPASGPRPGSEWGWTGVNPGRVHEPPPVPPPVIKPPSGIELAKVLKRASDSSPELACFLVLAAATGARRSEPVALRWCDVDLADGVVRIERGVVMGPDGLVEKGTKTHAPAGRRSTIEPSRSFELTGHG